MKKPARGSGKNFTDELAEHLERSSLWAVVRYAIGGSAVGILLGEAPSVIHRCIDLTSDDAVLRTVFVITYFCAALLVPVCVVISTKAALVRFLESRRVDLALAAAIGFGTGLCFHGIAARYTIGAVSQLTAIQMLCLFILPCALLTIFLASALLDMRRPRALEPNPTFFSDGELKSPDEGMLDVRPDAERFRAERYAVAALNNRECIPV